MQADSLPSLQVAVANFAHAAREIRAIIHRIGTRRHGASILRLLRHSP